MRVKIKGHYIVLDENRPPIERAVKALHISREVTSQRIFEVANIYDVNIEMLTHLYREGVRV